MCVGNEMKNNIMGLVGCFVWMSLNNKFRDNPDVLVALLKLDRRYWNNSGLNPMEWGLCFKTKEQEENFSEQISLVGLSDEVRLATEHKHMEGDSLL